MHGHGLMSDRPRAVAAETGNINKRRLHIKYIFFFFFSTQPSLCAVTFLLSFCLPGYVGTPLPLRYFCVLTTVAWDRRLINAIGNGQRISLSKLAITHLEQTSRPIRIAVDISIWLFQIQAGRGGKNPELRTLFYRLLNFLSLPIHPLFVFDGPNKPPFKRGRAVGHGAKAVPIIHLSKRLVNLFKFPTHDAPGEAEAECARLQSAGVVDAVMSNDVDALMFGSTWTVMNFSREGGRASAASHVTSYQMATDLDHLFPPNAELDRPGMILFALLSGGDYLPSGVPKCGRKLAAEIAKAGFGKDLMAIINPDEPDIDSKLSEWRERLQDELDENISGYFLTKHRAVKIPDAFPDPQLWDYYAHPVVSGSEDVEALRCRLYTDAEEEIDALEIRKFTAEAFDWNYRSGAKKVIRLLAEPLVSHRLRLGRPVMADKASHTGLPTLQDIHKTRTSYYTDGLVELHVDIVPVDVVGLDLAAEEPNPPLILPEAAHSDGEEEGKETVVEAMVQSYRKPRVSKPYDPYASEKIWIFEALASIGIPDVLSSWKQEQTAKSAKSSAPMSSTGRKARGKKGVIDPSMKSGSILKYGTIKKTTSSRTMPADKEEDFLDVIASSPTIASPSSQGYYIPPCRLHTPVSDSSTDLLSRSTGVNKLQFPLDTDEQGAMLNLSQPMFGRSHLSYSPVILPHLSIAMYKSHPRMYQAILPV